MAIHSQTFAIITNRLILKFWKKLNIPTKYEKNRTKPGNPYYLVLFENRTKPGTVLSETVLSGDPLYKKKRSYQKKVMNKGVFCESLKEFCLFGLSWILQIWVACPGYGLHIPACLILRVGFLPGVKISGGGDERSL